MAKKKKKLQSSRFEDTVKDYARTNSAYAEDNRRRAKETGADDWKAPLNTTEKVLIVVGILAVIGCIVKYVIL